MKAIKDNYQIIIIIALLALLFIHRIVPPTQAPNVTIIRDTVYHTNTQTIPAYQPVIVSSHPPSTIKEVYRPDTSYLGLLRQYNAILQAHLSTNVYRDTIRLDTVGYVAITDSIRQNHITNRKPSYSYRVPIITNTVTIEKPPSRQLYIGGGINNRIGVEAGLLYKDKQDMIFGVKAGYDQAFGATIGVQSYWKIKIK